MDTNFTAAPAAPAASGRLAANPAPGFAQELIPAQEEERRLPQTARAGRYGKPLTCLMTTDTVGGVLVYAAALTRALRRYNVKVVLAAMGAPLSDNWKAEFKAMDHVTCLAHSGRLEWMDDPWTDVGAAGQWLMRLADQYQPDVVHLNNYAHALLDWKCPSLVVGHSCVRSWYQAVRGRPPSQRWRKYCCTVKRALRRADAVTAPTWAFLRTLTALYGPFRSIGAVYNGLDRAQQPCPKEKLVFAAGRFWDEGKNLAILKEVQPLVSVQIVVAGSLEHPDGSVADAGGLRHLGHLTPPQVGQWYARSAVYVLPALYEPFGLSALEAAHAGCALVLGDIPSLREVWADAAVFVDPQDKRGVARAIQSLIEVPSLRAEYARKAAARASFYSVARMASRYFSVYTSLLKNEPVYARATAMAAL